jgi:hypothetical protein
MAERGKGFPRISLSSAIQIIDSASKFGKEWNKETFATYGAKNNAGSAKSGAFLSRLSALKEYGLITTDKNNVAITELGTTITKPISETERADAIKKAFLLVGTFSDLFNSLEGGEKLPKERVVEYAVHNLGISRDSKDKFINCFIDSGKYVRLVIYDKDSETVLLNKPLEGQDASAPENKVDEASATDNALSTSVQPGLTNQINIGSTGAALNEQGVNHSGDGWALTVIIKSSHRLPAELRKAIRDLLENADGVADQFYELEQKEN